VLMRGADPLLMAEPFARRWLGAPASSDGDWIKPWFAAYERLMDGHSEGDEIFNFVFSRGAYTARSLAGLISKRGLLIPGVHIVRQPSLRAISKWRPSVDLRARVDG
jgi:hypothetical protein